MCTFSRILRMVFCLSAGRIPVVQPLSTAIDGKLYNVMIISLHIAEIIA